MTLSPVSVPVRERNWIHINPEQFHDDMIHQFFRKMMEQYDLTITESCHPIFRPSSAFERGKLDIKEYGKKFTRFDDNEGNKMLLRTVISVNQFGTYG